ncbi:MAG: NAD(P)H-dependent glycerol-3-phosphate dehydrogenase, partial [Candidatus Dormibacteria bacterium]
MRVAIIGSGSWGTALACALAEGGPTAIWCRHPQDAVLLGETRHNPRYLTEARIPDSVEVHSDIARALSGAAIVVMAVPAKAMEATAKGVAAVMRTQARRESAGPLVLSGAKGLDPDTGRRMSEVLRDALGASTPVGAISGPNIAREVADGLPCATVVSCRDLQVSAMAQKRISGHRLRAYTNDDVVGVEIGGAMKNVIALAAGIGDGMGAGDNAKATIMTRGLIEMSRLGAALGARASTFSGLTGLGDLIVTCASPHSRNRQFGIAIGEGRSVAEVEASMTMIAEGVNTTREAVRLGRSLGVELPIAEGVARVLFEGFDR